MARLLPPPFGWYRFRAALIALALGFALVLVGPGEVVSAHACGPAAMSAMHMPEQTAQDHEPCKPGGGRCCPDELCYVSYSGAGLAPPAIEQVAWVTADSSYAETNTTVWHGVGVCPPAPPPRLELTV